MSALYLSVTARAELDELMHGPCEPAFLTALHQALSTTARPGTEVVRGSGEQQLHRLRALGEVLPAAQRLAEEPGCLATLLAWTAVADPSLCLTALAHYLLCLGSMLHLSDGSELLSRHLDALKSGRAKGVYMITEVGQANSHLATLTRADLDPLNGDFMLRTPEPGAAKFCSAGSRSLPQTGVVLARLTVAGTDRGVFAFVVDLTDGHGLLPGVEMSSRLELSAVPLDYVQVRFHDIRVPRHHWLCDGARIHPDGTFHDPAGSLDQRLQRTLRVAQGLWATLPAVAAATCRQSAALAVNYARQRRTQGRLAPGMPLLAYRTQQRAVLGALADAFAVTCAARTARSLWTQTLPAPAQRCGPPAPVPSPGFTPWTAVSQPLSVYKAAAVRLADRVVAECQRRCGFSGHLDINQLASYRGFHHAFDAAGGDNQLIFYDVGRSLVAQQPPTDRPVPEGPEPSPLSPNWWPAVARRHEAQLTARLRNACDAGTDGTQDPFGQWNPLLEDAGLLGEFHGTRRMAEDVTDVLGQVRDETLARALTSLAALHGVTAARRWAGSLLAEETVRPADIRALAQAADQLCDELLPQLPWLTGAFAYPEDITAAPLAASDCNAGLNAAVTWSRGGVT